MWQTGFSDIAWGKATRSYAISAQLLLNVKFDAIVEDAKEFLKPTRSRNKNMEAMEIININNDNDDEQALLVYYNSDGPNWLLVESLHQTSTSIHFYFSSSSASLT